MKTMVRPSLRAFFYRRPFDPLPPPYLRFIALDRPTFRALATEPIVAQQTPDVSGMVLDARQLLDERRDPRKGPQIRLVTAAHRASDQSLHNHRCLDRRQLGFAARLALAGKARLAVLLPHRLPSVGDLAAHIECSGDLRG